MDTSSGQHFAAGLHKTRQYLLNLFVQASDVAVLLRGTFVHLHGFHTRVIPAHTSQHPTLHIPTLDTRHGIPLYTYRQWTHIMAPHFTHTDTGCTSWHPTLDILTLGTHHGNPLYTYWQWTHVMTPHLTHTNNGHTLQHPSRHTSWHLTLHTPTPHTCLICLLEDWHTHDCITYTLLSLHSYMCWHHIKHLACLMEIPMPTWHLL